MFSICIKWEPFRSTNEKRKTKPIFINSILYPQLRSQSLLHLQSFVHGRSASIQVQQPVQPFSGLHLHLTNCLWMLLAVLSTTACSHYQYVFNPIHSVVLNQVIKLTRYSTHDQQYKQREMYVPRESQKLDG